MRSLLVCCVSIAISTMSMAAFAQEGKNLFRQCASCHVLEADGPARIGPHLAELGGRKAASVAGYRYSDALLDHSRQGLVWTEETLDQFLASPAAFVPGTKMGFAGVSDAARRSVLVIWLLDATADANSTESTAIRDDVKAVLSQEADADYGEYLAGECLTCHKAEGSAGGVPSIVGLPAERFVRAILDYRNGTRTNQVMGLMAGNLADAEIAALALYFSTL
ncbi:hypothetical protein AB833_15925 [Chromatiales bacterium (ex Bugula neritina AB1)]|nr:hypothetical protein AB833_15925 [Chromatiales bacterium (ex Bugula neritina AB1)]